MSPIASQHPNTPTTDLPITHHPSPITHHQRPRLGALVQHFILIAASLIALFPLWFMIWTALRTSDDYFRAPLGWPQDLHVENFAAAFQANIGRWVVNSTIVTAGAVLLVTLVSVPAAYTFVRLPFRGSDLLLKLFVFLMVIPPIVMLLPIFALMSALGRVNHFDAVIVAYAGLMFPFSVFMMVRYIEGIPNELYEAAFVEGASHLRILWSIVVPLVGPALVTLGIVNALWAWNELLIAVVMLQREESRTLQAGLALLKGKNTMDIPLVMAGATISAIPLLLVYLFGQRVFMRGLLAGAVKE
jgi:ABC-type glycerol-3-phosphate transport system permease component